MDAGGGVASGLGKAICTVMTTSSSEAPGDHFIGGTNIHAAWALGGRGQELSLPFAIDISRRLWASEAFVGIGLADTA